MTREEFCKKQDHSCLGWACPREMVDQYIDETLKYGFASLIVNPDQVEYCASRLEGRSGLGAVIGFPQGFMANKLKIEEGLTALSQGATDLDYVTNFSLLADKRDGELLSQYRDFVNAVRDKKPETVVKIIMYKPYCSEPVLCDNEIIRVSNLIMESGADYIKFCGAFPLIRSIVSGKLQMKHSGCADFKEAVDAIEKGVTRIGHVDAPKWLAEVDDSFWDAQ